MADILRNSGPVTFTQGDRRAVQSRGLGEGKAAVDADVSTQGNRIKDTSWFDRLFNQLSDTTQRGLNNLADAKYNALYLEGQAKAGLIESEDEIEGNPLTRDWEVAGYRDAMGKLALAEQRTQWAEDVQRLRSQPPEKMAEYLAQRRRKMVPAMTGMSRDARAAMVSQLEIQDRQSNREYTAERQKYIIEQKSQAVTTLTSTSLAHLKKAQTMYHAGDMDQKTYMASVHEAAGTLAGSIWSDASLPTEVKQNLTYQMLQMTLSNDSVDLHDFISENPINVDGQKATLIARLNGSQQDMLAEQYRAAKNRTADARNLAFMGELASVEADIASGSYNGTFNGLQEYLNPLVIRGAIPGEKRQAILKQFLTQKREAEDTTNLGAAMIRGDYMGIVGRGSTPEQAMKAVNQLLYKTQADPAKRLDTYLTIGKNGFSEGYKEAGKQLSVALSNVVGADGEVLSQHLKTFQTVFDSLDAAERRGDTNARLAILTGLPEDQRMQYERIHAMVHGGASLEKAMLESNKAKEMEEKLSPSAKAALATGAAEATTGAMQAVEPLNVMEYMWKSAKGMFSEDDSLDTQLMPYSSFSSKDGWFSDSKALQQYSNIISRELGMEIEHVRLQNPLERDQGAIVRTAKANLVGRSIPTSSGPLVFPKGMQPSGYFGVSEGNAHRIGPALDAVVKPSTSDSSIVYQFANNRLVATEMTPDGVSMREVEIRPEQVRAEMKRMADAENKRSDQIWGQGKTVKGSQGASVTYNGQNTAGVSGEAMMAFRDDLVEHEGVTRRSYPDGSGGRTSVGVGINTSNEFSLKKDSMTDEEISDTFKNASNAAAKGAIAIMRERGVEDNVPLFRALGSMAYQSGNQYGGGKRLQAVRQMTRAVAAGNEFLALENLRDTNAYRFSAEKRRAHYEKLIKQAIRGR